MPMCTCFIAYTYFNKDEHISNLLPIPCIGTYIHIYVYGYISFQISNRTRKKFASVPLSFSTYAIHSRYEEIELIATEFSNAFSLTWTGHCFGEYKTAHFLSVNVILPIRCF